MQLLLGYLVALAVFLGGGYAGVQWLLTPDDPAALAQNSRAESASSRLINAKKIRDARALHRKLAESLAEDGGKPAPARTESEAAVAEAGDRSAKTADHSDAGAVAKAPQVPAAPQLPDATVAATDAKLDARAEVGPAVAPAKIKSVQNQPEAQQKPAGKPGDDSVAVRKSAEAKAGPASPAAVGRSASASDKKQAVAKKQRPERVASSSHRPVMMILRTIEFPDGRREQRLLPMSQARAGLPRYGNVAAFADDDDF
ncbi:MAG: hypothetical protein QOD09_4203 [Bradyrhizobium sp.]|jgi:hypothetical protein|nr:hypothetical protein [Bradyrhizobium sp.]